VIAGLLGGRAHNLYGIYQGLQHDAKGSSGLEHSVHTIHK
jgi:hypothetical protein